MLFNERAISARGDHVPRACVSESLPNHSVSFYLPTATSGGYVEVRKNA
jgi:hypothetical protein